MRRLAEIQDCFSMLGFATSDVRFWPNPYKTFVKAVPLQSIPTWLRKLDKGENRKWYSLIPLNFSKLYLNPK